MGEKLLEVNNLKVYYPVKGKSLLPTKQYVKAVDGISFFVERREAFGIVGESGCGKSTTGHAVVGLLRPTEGEILFDGERIDTASRRRSKEMCRKVQIILQDPYSSLDSRFTVGRCIREPLDVHRIGTVRERQARVEELMKEVGLNREQITKFPHEFSGGQRQRIGIARALALNPELIVCDEPVSALDVSIQAQVLNLMQELKQQYGLAYIFISHNLSVVSHLCDRIAVMYLGNIVEQAKQKDLFRNPLHPYTKALLEAIPIPDPTRTKGDTELEGDVPSPLCPPPGCCFHTRCVYAEPICTQIKPSPVEAEPGHVIACHFAGQITGPAVSKDISKKGGIRR